MIIVKYKDGSDYRKLNPFYQNIQYSQIIDQYGGFSFDYPETDPKSQFLTDRNEVQIFDDTTLLFAGKITNSEIKYVQDVPIRSVTGVELLEEFANEVTLPNILFQNELYTDVLDPTYPNTLIKPTTWQTTVESTLQDLTYLSSMQSSLKTFQIVKRQAGFHFRYIGDISTPRKVEFGTFGVNTGYRLRAQPNDRLNIASNLLVIEDNGLTQVRDSLSVINWIYPIGGGGDNGVNQLTLRDVDSGILDPDYPIYIDSGTPNSDTIYDPNVFSNIKTGPNTYQAFYLKDPDSITTYGEIKKPISFSDIYPVSTAGADITDLDRQNAANELYKASVEFIKNNKDVKIAYNVTCWGKSTVLVGDKINLKFNGKIQKLNQNSSTSTIWASINQDLYITGITTALAENGIRRYTLTLANTLEFPQDDLNIISGAIDSINDTARQRKGSVTTYPVYFDDSFDSTYPAEFLLWIPNQTVFTDYLKLKIRLKPFRAYERATNGGGSTTQSTSSAASHSHDVTIPSHTHIITLPISKTGPTTSPLFANFNLSPSLVAPSLPGSTIVTDISAAAGGGSFQTSTSAGSHTHDVTLPNHTHTIDFGIYEDSSIPTGVKIFIDGVDYSSELGVYNALGDFPVSAQDNFDLLSAAFNLGVLSSILTTGVHTLQVKCTSGRARVQLSIFSQFYLSSQ